MSIPIMYLLTLPCLSVLASETTTSASKFSPLSSRNMKRILLGPSPTVSSSGNCFFDSRQESVLLSLIFEVICPDLILHGLTENTIRPYVASSDGEVNVRCQHGVAECCRNRALSSLKVVL